MSTRKTTKTTSSKLKNLRKTRSTQDDYLDAKWKERLKGMPTYTNDEVLINRVLEEDMPRSRNDLSQQIIEAIKVIEKEIVSLCRYARLCARTEAAKVGQPDVDCIGWDSDTSFPVTCLIMNVEGKTESEVRNLARSITADIWRKRTVRDAWMSGLTKADNPEEYLAMMRERGVPVDSNR